MMSEIEFPDLRKRPAILEQKRFTADEALSPAEIRPLELQDEEVKVEVPEVEEIEVKEENDEENEEFYVGEENEIEEIGNDSKK